MSEEESFKVTDRRGRAKPVEGGEPQSPDFGQVRPSDPPPSGTGLAGERQKAPRPSAPGPPDLQALFVMFASSALVHLGEASDPVSGERHLDLDQARQAIDLLLLLRDKTNGNRTEQESHLLEEVLYDLQLRFVRATPSQPSH
jgi:hypothetical protein